MYKRPRIGVVNWDGALTDDTHVGKYTINSLSHPNHINRLPYFTKKDENGSYYFADRTQAEYDEELTLAADAGIDFFMYCWYPEEKETLAALNRARHLYQSSEVNRRIKMCAILVTPNAYSEKDIDLLTDAMLEDYYEKKDGRPLVFFFGGYKPNFFSAIRERASKKGLTPYIVFMNNGPESENGDYSEADAVSAYASEVRNVETYEQVADQTLVQNENRKKYGVPILPMLSAGWNPQPRIDRPVPWYKYKETSYAPHPTGDQMEAATLDLFRWMEENKEYVDEDYFVTFAWNEFEEGGYLCPTLTQSGDMNGDTLNGLARALKSRKNP